MHGVCSSVDAIGDESVSVVWLLLFLNDDEETTPDDDDEDEDTRLLLGDILVFVLLVFVLDDGLVSIFKYI